MTEAGFQIAQGIWILAARCRVPSHPHSSPAAARNREQVPVQNIVVLPSFAGSRRVDANASGADADATARVFELCGVELAPTLA